MTMYVLQHDEEVVSIPRLKVLQNTVRLLNPDFGRQQMREKQQWYAKMGYQTNHERTPSLPMNTLLDLSKFVTFHNEAAEEQLWEWFSAQVYELLLKKERDSLIVRVNQRFDLHKVVAACEGYHRYAGGVGQPADYPVLRLCWALLLRYLCGWSLRIVEEQMRVNLLVRWCTRFALQEQTPDHSTLARFENWVRAHALDVLFVAVLEQIDVDFPDDARKLLCGDTFGVYANVADVSLTTLLRQSCRRLLLALETTLPAAYAACMAQIDLTALFGADDERPEQHLTPAARDERTLVTAIAATHCLDVVLPIVSQQTGSNAEATDQRDLRKWCDVVKKILADEFTDKPLPAPKPAKPAKPAKPSAAAKRGDAAPVAPPAPLPPTQEETEPITALTSLPLAAEEVAALPTSAICSAQRPIDVQVEEVAAPPTSAICSAQDSVEVQVEEVAAPPAPAPTDSLPSAQHGVILTASPQPATTTDAKPPALRRCTDDERGEYRIISATDTDATIRKHGKSVIPGYNAAILASANFVRDVEVYTGATPDGSTVAPSAATHLEQFGFAPERLVYDRAAGTPKHIADVHHASDGQTQLVARQIQHGQRNGRFAPTDFTRSANGLTCPNGVVSTTAYRSGAGDGFHFRFTASQCQGCPLMELCRKPDAKAGGHRTAFISDHALLHEAELAYLDTPAAKADFSFRANVERHIAALTLHNGARRAKVRGLDKVHFQLTMAATAYNLKRWHVMTLEQERQGCDAAQNTGDCETDSVCALPQRRKETSLCASALSPPA